jgi:hypothetical protein
MLNLPVPPEARCEPKVDTRTQQLHYIDIFKSHNILAIFA